VNFHSSIINIFSDFKAKPFDDGFQLNDADADANADAGNASERLSVSASSCRQRRRLWMGDGRSLDSGTDLIKLWRSKLECLPQPSLIFVSKARAYHVGAWNLYPDIPCQNRARRKTFESDKHFSFWRRDISDGVTSVTAWRLWRRGVCASWRLWRRDVCAGVTSVTAWRLWRRDVCVGVTSVTA
jgi:hypothetical protein